ncbi:Uncharacterized protein Fot_37539 [Forsythia ovata]|uniref:Uncharacterized protein n=1 Tax=Forsythia ovata TaxID=205694 RepID=A0ABD1RZ95_9LAMI
MVGRDRQEVSGMDSDCQSPCGHEPYQPPKLHSLREHFIKRKVYRRGKSKHNTLNRLVTILLGCYRFGDWEQENVVRKRKRESQPFKDEKYMRVRSKESETPPWLKSPVTYARERENAVNLPPCKAIKVRPAKIRVRFPQAQPNSKKIILSLT